MIDSLVGRRRVGKFDRDARQRRAGVLYDSWLHPRHIGTVYSNAAISQACTYIKGALLDVGCGLRPFEDILRSRVDRYIGLDWPVDGGLSSLDLRGDACELPFKNESVDCVLAAELMEHLAQPGRFLEEAQRVLKPRGTLIVTVPFLEPIHEAPRDFFRYTPFGLRVLLNENGFNIVESWRKGGFWSVVFGSFAAQSLHNLVHPVQLSGQRRIRPWALPFTIPICAVLQLLGFGLDKIFRSDVYALGYVLVAERVKNG